MRSDRRARLQSGRRKRARLVRPKMVGTRARLVTHCPDSFTIGGLRAPDYPNREPVMPEIDYCTAASFSGSFTASKVSISRAQGSPSNLSILRI